MIQFLSVSDASLETSRQLSPVEPVKSCTGLFLAVQLQSAGQAGGAQFMTE